MLIQGFDNWLEQEERLNQERLVENIFRLDKEINESNDFKQKLECISKQNILIAKGLAGENGYYS